MLFNIVILVITLAIAYFHYAQGLFSAALSAILCIIASALAIGYHELLTPYLMKMPEEADAIAILGLFIAGYIIPRLIMDKVVPGNVRFPLLVDKIGAGVFGLIAGLFASGIFALAMQSMPFGPSIGGYSRQEVQDVANVTVPGEATSNGRNSDTSISEEMVGDHLGDPSRAGRLYFHQDDLVLAFARQFSDTGSALSNDRPLEEVHPDYLTELFGQRLGSPVGAKRLAVNTDQAKTMGVSSAYRLAKAPPSMDNEIAAVRGELTTGDFPAGDNTFAVLRTVISPNPDLTDADGLVRFSPAAVRLKAGTTDYYPVGTMVGGILLLKNRADDTMMADLKKGPQTIDFLYVIANDDLSIKTDGKEKKVQFKDGSFLQFKRYAVQDLRGMEISSDVPSTTVEAGSDGVLGGVLRKTFIVQEATKKLTGIPVTPTARSKAARGEGNNGNNGNKNNSQDLLPDLPNHQMGL